MPPDLPTFCAFSLVLLSPSFLTQVFPIPPVFLTPSSLLLPHADIRCYCCFSNIHIKAQACPALSLCEMLQEM